MVQRLAQLGLLFVLPLACSSSSDSGACVEGTCAKEESEEIAYLQGRISTAVLQSDRGRASPHCLTDAAPNGTDTAPNASASGSMPWEPLCNWHGKTAAVVTDGVNLGNNFNPLVTQLRDGGIKVCHLRRRLRAGDLEESIATAGCTTLGLLFVFLDGMRLSEVDLKYMEKVADEGATVVLLPNFFDATIQAARFFYNLTITEVAFGPFVGCTPQIVPGPHTDKCLTTQRIVKGWSALQTTVYLVLSHGELCTSALKFTEVLTTNSSGSTVDLVRPFGKGKVILGSGIVVSLSSWFGTCSATTPDQQRMVQNLWNDAACH